MTQKEILNQIFVKRSLLCTGLDTDPVKIPSRFDGDMLAFNKYIVDATALYSIAFKPNLAFYEAMGAYGWEVLEETATYIKDKYPEIFLIVDAKIGDIGNTSAMYAKALFGNMPFDAITLSGYMGKDVVEPFLAYPDKTVILLALTSNKSAAVLQKKELKSGLLVYEDFIQESKNWGSIDQIMWVVGATNGKEDFGKVRAIVPGHTLLVPGIGAQGGSLENAIQFGGDHIIVNNSRAIIYADDPEEAAALQQQQMETLLGKYGLLK
jgi:orotidine-5'-phosphate decarboxylase